MAVAPDRLIGIDSVTGNHAGVTPGSGLQFTGKTLVPSYGTTTGTVAQGDDSRFGQALSAVKNGNAGALAKGDAVYMNGTADEADLGDADALATSRIVGIVAATIGIGATGNIITSGLLTTAGTFGTIGGKVFLTVTGTTGNTLSQTAPSGSGKCVVCVGIAKNGTDLLVQIGEPLEL